MKNEDDDKESQAGLKVKMAESLASYGSSERSSSTGGHNPKFVFVESNRDVLMEIGYAEDKARLVELFRPVEWDPTFWSLNDEIVNWFNNDDGAATSAKIEELKLAISEKRAELINTRKKMRMMNKVRGIFDPALNVFPDLVEPPNTDEPSGDFRELASSFCQLIRELEKTKIRNMENEFKLESMEEKLTRLREDVKSFEERNKNFDVNAHLMAVETQNLMLNELLTSIIEKIKQTSQDMENLKSSDPKVLLKIIREACDVNFAITNGCFPNMESRPGVSQWLWLPHDVKHMSFEQYLKTIQPKEHSLEIKIDWKQRKKTVKEVEETRDKIMKLKRKIKWIDQRKAAGEYGTILHMTEAERQAHEYGPLNEMQP